MPEKVRMRSDLRKLRGFHLTLSYFDVVFHIAFFSRVNNVRDSRQCCCRKRTWKNQRSNVACINSTYYGTDLGTNQRPCEMRETRWSATICDISQGGLGLYLQRRYEKGAALAVELPGDADHPASVVFVRVIHVKRGEEGLWRLGMQVHQRIERRRSGQRAES